MRREDVRHIARAAAKVAGVRRVLVVGSQAVLGTFSDARLPPEATRSMEADIVILDDDADGSLSNLVDGAIGFGSRFHVSFNVYADGVDLRTSILPDGWEGRVVTEMIEDLETDEPVTVHYLEVHDLCVAKLIAGRPNDKQFVAALVAAELVDPGVLNERIRQLNTVEPVVREAVGQIVRGLAKRRPFSPS